MTGSAFCKYCRSFNKRIPLTGFRDADGTGGWNWQVAPNSLCPKCGEKLLWMHQPAPKLVRASASAAAKPSKVVLEKQRSRAGRLVR